MYNLSRLSGKSIRGAQFRIWATKVVKEKLLELVNVVRYIGRITEGKALEKEEAVGLLHFINDYSHALEILDQYEQTQVPRLKLQALNSKVCSKKDFACLQAGDFYVGFSIVIYCCYWGEEKFLAPNQKDI
ncbi:MAG: hypothetical protein IH597_15845 [Bacteroidales bacterium]|nr:hypothetical protein [Bacteroidales bacterium]